MFERRVLLKVGLAGLASLLPRAVASQSPPSVPATQPAGEAPKAAPEASAFDPGSVIEAARAISKKPYKAPAADLPEAFSALNFEQYAAIRNQPGAAICGHHSAVARLLLAGASSTALYRGKTALQWAQGERHTRCVEAMHGAIDLECYI